MTTYTSRETYEFISRQTNDPIVEWKTCKISGQPFPIFQSDLDFYEKISPVFNGKKYQVPFPTLCPEERQRRRVSFRNERNLYRRSSDFSGKEIISIYTPDAPYKVYAQEERRSDSRDPRSYGRDFDFSKTFLEQYRELCLAVPRPAIQNMKSENCAYTNYSAENKNCYLAMGVGWSENCHYSYRLWNCDNNMDCYDLVQCSFCYECLEGTNLYHSTFCQNCHASSSLQFCRDCTNCQYCFGCVGLRNKQYCIYNQPVEKSEYEALISAIDPKVAQQKAMKLSLEFPYRNLETVNIQHSCGDRLTDCNHCSLCFICQDSEHEKYFTIGQHNKDCQDCDFGDHAQLQYDSANLETNFNILWGNLVRYCSDGYYLTVCFNSKHCFGCVGLKQHEYCILNKQYTKEEYEVLVPQIIEQMQKTGERGEFFHPSLSPFGYNETIANEYYLIEKADSRSQEWNTFSQLGYRWSDFSSDPKIPENASFLYPAKMTDEEWKNFVHDEGVLTKIIICEESNRPFFIQKSELAFYRKMGLPLPKQHPDVRHIQRMKQRPGRTLHLRSCDKCQKEMLSVYPVGDAKKVYCEECYQQEVYG